MLPRKYNSGCNFTALLWRIKQESGVREICTLRLTWRGRETSYDSMIGGTPRGNGEQRKDRTYEYGAHSSTLSTVPTHSVMRIFETPTAHCRERLRPARA